MLKVILPAKMIPDNSTVTKINGHTKLLLVSNIPVYSEDVGGKCLVINAEGVKYLVGGIGGITAIKDDQQLVWHVPDSDLLQWLNNRLFYGDEKQ